jgi:hypothetical protein
LFESDAFNEGFYGCFTIDADEEYFLVSSAGTLYKVDMNGKRLWRKYLGSDVRSGSNTLGALFSVNKNSIITDNNYLGIRKIIFDKNYFIKNNIIGDAIARTGDRNLENCIKEYITPNGKPYLFFTTEFGPSPDTIAYFNNIASNPEYAGHNFVLITHAMITEEGSLMSFSNPINPNHYNNIAIPSYASNGEDLWNNFVSKYPNFILVLCSHSYGSTPNVFEKSDITLIGEYGNNVRIIMRNNHKYMNIAYSSVGFDSFGNIYIEDIEINKDDYVFLENTIEPN